MIIPAFLIGYIIIITTGLIIVRRLSASTKLGLLESAWTIALGLGMAGHAVFYTACVLNQHNPILPTVILMAIIAICLLKNKMTLPLLSIKWDALSMASLVGFIILTLLLFFEASLYPLGGWDAWSCWNLKAKFLFAGKDYWQNIFDPVLWRSNTHYPILLPSINVFFFHLTGGTFNIIPQINSIVFTLITAVLLYASITSLTRINRLTALLICAAFFLVPLNILLGVSQYSDILFALYLLCIFSSWVYAHQHQSKRIFILCGIFTGLLTFTKVEGMAAGAIMSALIISELIRSKQWSFLKYYIIGLIIGALPTIIFQLNLTVNNEAFINGLLSADKPSHTSRLWTIIVMTFKELIDMKWNGLWLLIIVGTFLIPRNKNISIVTYGGIFFASYALIVFAYYYINTFFAIDWWINTTLHRILFALGPAIIFVISLGLSRRLNK